MESIPSVSVSIMDSEGNSIETNSLPSDRKISLLSLPEIFSKERSPSVVSALSPIDEEIEKRLSTGTLFPKHTGWKRYLGIILTILSAITFSFNALIAKLLNQYNPFNIGVWTFQLMTYFSLCTMLYQKRRQKLPYFRDIWPLSRPGNGMHIISLLIRAICGASALLFFFYSMKYISLADALVIDSSSPIFVYILAYFLFGEKCGLLPVITTLVAIIGVALITRPPMLTGDVEYNMDSLIGSAFAFACMMCIVFSIIALKFLDNVPQGISNFALGGWGTLQCLAISIFLGVLKVPTDFDQIWKITATAVLFFLGQAFITTALQYEDAGPVSLLRTSELFFAFLWQFLFLDVVPDLYSVLGAILILCGVVLTVVRKWVIALPLEHAGRKYLSILLV